MDILDRLLKHDAWATRQLLLHCRDLTDEQLNQHFDLGHETLRTTLAHIIENMEVWTDLMNGQPAPPDMEPKARAESVDGLIERLDAAAVDFAAQARKMTDEGRLDEWWIDTLDDPPTTKTYGSTIAHVITHSMHHRGEALHMLRRLGVEDLIEGDVLDWEHHERDRRV